MNRPFGKDNKENDWDQLTNVNTVEGPVAGITCAEMEKV